jgi:hypothetical protein
MKIFKMLSALVLNVTLLQANAQTDAPKGFNKGTLVLADNSSVTGYIKDNSRRDAAVIFFKDGKETNYKGADLVSMETGAGKFICISGDFFKVATSGELSFLQKSSDASSQATFNGTEAMFINGTAGAPGDYFIYNNSSKQLKLVSKKNLNDVVAKSFEGYTPAVEKAKTAQTDIALLKDAIEIYNNRKGK